MTDSRRITLNLSDRAHGSLTEIQRRTGDSITEAVSKALQAYALIQRAQDSGGKAWLQDTPSAERVQVKFY